MQRVQANMTLFYKSNTIAELLLHVHFVILKSSQLCTYTSTTTSR